MKIKKYQPGGSLTGYDKEISVYKDSILKAEPKIQQRKDAYTALTSGETPLKPTAAKHLVYSQGIQNTDDNFAVQWHTQRQKARPDLLTENDVNYIKDRLSTLQYTTPDSIANRAEAYVANKGTVNGPLANFIDVYKQPLSGYDLDYFIENVSPERTKQHIINDWKKETVAGMYYPERHQIITNPYASSLAGKWPKELSKLHEETHSYQMPFLNQVANIAKKYGLNPNKYENHAKEIHARLMTFRKDYNIDPNKRYTLEDVQQLKQNWSQKRADYGFSETGDPESSYHNHGLLFNYSDNMIMDLLNNVALNNQNKGLGQRPNFTTDNNTQFAKLGAKLKPYDFKLYEK